MQGMFCRLLGVILVIAAGQVGDAFAAKYDGYRTQGRGFFVLIPRVALGWSAFPKDATRWRFDTM